MQLSGQNLERRWEEKLTRKREGKVFTPTSSHGRKVPTKPTIEEMLPNSQKIGDIYLKKKDNVRWAIYSRILHYLFLIFIYFISVVSNSLANINIIHLPFWGIIKEEIYFMFEFYFLLDIFYSPPRSFLFVKVRHKLDVINGFFYSVISIK